MNPFAKCFFVFTKLFLTEGFRLRVTSIVIDSFRACLLWQWSSICEWSRVIQFVRDSFRKVVTFAKRLLSQSVSFREVIPFARNSFLKVTPLARWFLSQRDSFCDWFLLRSDSSREVYPFTKWFLSRHDSCCKCYFSWVILFASSSFLESFLLRQIPSAKRFLSRSDYFHEMITTSSESFCEWAICKMKSYRWWIYFLVSHFANESFHMMFLFQEVIHFVKLPFRECFHWRINSFCEWFLLWSDSLREVNHLVSDFSGEVIHFSSFPFHDVISIIKCFHSRYWRLGTCISGMVLRFMIKLKVIEIFVSDSTSAHKIN